MKFHCAYGYINFLRTIVTLVFIAAVAACSLLFYISPPSGIAVFAFILPVYIVFFTKIIPLFVGSHLYTGQRNCFLICGGIIFRKVRHIPRTAIISMNIRQNFIEKIFNIMNIEFVLGSGKIHLWGLSEADARKIFKYRS